jgi:hypothetical protein
LGGGYIGRRPDERIKRRLNFNWRMHRNGILDKFPNKHTDLDNRNDPTKVRKPLIPIKQPRKQTPLLGRWRTRGIRVTRVRGERVVSRRLSQRRRILAESRARGVLVGRCVGWIGLGGGDVVGVEGSFARVDWWGVGFFVEAWGCGVGIVDVWFAGGSGSCGGYCVVCFEEEIVS